MHAASMPVFLCKGLVTGDNEEVRTVAGVAFPDWKATIFKISLLRFTVTRMEELEDGIEESVIVKADILSGLL